MIVDVHTHFFRPELDFGPALQSDLARCGVNPAVWGDVGERHLETTREADVAVVFGLQAGATGWNIPNDAVAAHVRRAPDRLLFFTALDPLHPGVMEELEHSHQDLGAVGVKLAPLYQNVHPCDPRCREIYRYCQRHGLPVLFHAGTSFVGGTLLEYSRPVHFDAVAVEFPDLRMVLAHLGHPWEGETIAVIRRHANVFADLSALYYRPWQFYNSMRLLVEYRSEAKVLFGSDFPFTTTGSSLAGVRGLNGVIAQSGLPPVPEEVIEGIIHRDTLGLLGPQEPGGPQPSMSAHPTMQALQLQAVGSLVPVRLPVPVPWPEEVLIRTLAATICTSDLHDIARNPFGIALPRVLGHEAAGVVVGVGDAVTGLVPGTRVAVHPVVPCGACVECLRGMGHLCARMGHLGCDRDGAFAEYFVQRADRVRVLPDGVPSTLGALLEPVAVCLQAIARAGTLQGREVLVAGDGPFGNIIARLAVRAGAGRVRVSGRTPFRLGRIPGVEVSGSVSPSSVDVAILAVSSAAAAAFCLDALRPRGRMVVFSALPDAVPLDLMTVHLREKEIVGACNDEERLDDALHCLADPALALHELITHVLPFAEWAEAFALARDGHDRALKVALSFPDKA